MFKEKGFLHLKNYFDPNKILNEANKTILICKKKKWKYVKVYHNIFINKFVNIFSINFPFNNKLNPNLYNEFIKINLKNPILENTKWKNFQISQIELQHNQKFNYQSTWHRDSKFSNLENIVAILYLRDANGFKLVPKNLENLVIQKYNFSREKNYKNGYRNLSNNYYHQFNVKAGDLVIFDAGLLHQGSCKGMRTQFFVRCIESANDNILNHDLKPNALLNNTDILSKNYNWNFNQNQYSLKKKLISIINLVIYYFPLLKLFKFILDVKKNKIHFHYSIFQK